MAEREGFEPSVPLWGTHDFQSCALDQLSHLSAALIYLIEKRGICQENLQYFSGLCAGRPCTAAPFAPAGKHTLPAQTSVQKHVALQRIVLRKQAEGQPHRPFVKSFLSRHPVPSAIFAPCVDLPCCFRYNTNSILPRAPWAKGK